jgi:DNA-binding IclR family transcriptional regulator
VAGVPAARHALRLLQAMARRPAPVAAAALARELDLPRSTTYHLLAELEAAGFVVHLAEERTWGLGVSAFDLGAAYERQAPLARLAHPVLARLVDELRHTAHLAVLHGREVLYLLEERAPGRPPLVTDVGVRLPAHLTASGRALLADLPAAHVSALFPDRTAFSRRHAAGPRSPTALRRLLVDVRRRGFAVEDGEVTPGYASVATAVHDHAGHPVAGVAVTYPTAEPSDPAALARAVRAAAGVLERRLSGRPRPNRP